MSGIFSKIFSASQFHHFIAMNFFIVSSSKRYLITRAGLPTAIAYGGISFATIAFVPIIAPLPIFTPPFIVAPRPIQTSLPIIT